MQKSNLLITLVFIVITGVCLWSASETKEADTRMYCSLISVVFGIGAVLGLINAGTEYLTKKLK